MSANVPELAVYLGNRVVERVALDVPTLTVGRQPDNSLVLSDPKVSRHHLRLVHEADGAYVAEDCESANGTWVGDIRITRAPLKDGIALRVGPYTLVMHSGAAVPMGAAPGEATILPGGAVREGAAVAAASAMPAWTLVVSDSEGERRLPIAGQTFTIGRGSMCDLVLHDPSVSVRHAHIERRDSMLTLTDDHSTNGTYVDGTRITSIPLTPGSVFSIGDTRLTIAPPGAPSIRIPLEEGHITAGDGRRADLAAELRTSLSEVPSIVPVAITSLQLEKDVVTIGRGVDNDIRLPNPQVSRHHARLRRSGTTHVIEDLGSTNGTFVNGERVMAKSLTVGDQIQISVFVITYNGATLQQVNTEGNIRLDAIHLNKWVSESKNLLQDISLSIYPREFVALVGTSGAGKSTLMDALNGQRPAQGTLLINGDNLYKNYDAYRTTLGYVPQEDIIHRELSVYSALDYAARLRLPPDTSKEERHTRIVEVLKELGLTEQRDLAIGRLSGGQRKRVSMGVELLTKPSLFFLDEPTSGLDPATETNMMHLLRQLADQGRTVLLITHATKNVALCDLVLFLTKGGNLAYYGPPDEATEYFGVREFEEIYAKLESPEVAPEEWSRRYRASPQYETYVLNRLAHYSEHNLAAAPGGFEALKHAPAAPAVKRPSALRQFIVLLQRDAEVLRKNRPSLIIVMMQAIFISAFLVILFPGHVFSTDADEGDARIASTVLFVMTTSGIFIGLSNGSKEFVKERNIFRRERAVSLQIAPYMWAKVVVLAVLGLIQSAIMIAVLSAGALLPRSDLVSVPPTYARLYLMYFVTILIGIMFGLLVSALVGTVDSAVGSIVLVFMPQMIFSGQLLAYERMRWVAKGLSSLMAGRWIFANFGNMAALPQLYDRLITAWQERVATGAATPQQAQAKIATIQALQTDYGKTFSEHVWWNWGALAAFFVVTAVGIYFALRRSGSTK